MAERKTQLYLAVEASLMLNIELSFVYVDPAKIKRNVA